MSNKSKLIHELEWALTLTKHSPKPNYDKIEKHVDNAQQQLEFLNKHFVSKQSELLFDFIQKYNQRQTSWDKVIDAETVELHLKGKL